MILQCSHLDGWQAKEESVRFYLPDEGVALQEKEVSHAAQVGCQGKAVEGCRDKTKKLLKIFAKIRLDAAKAKATAAVGEEHVSEDSESRDKDDIFEMIAAY
jgi:hypothetical protein